MSNDRNNQKPNSEPSGSQTQLSSCLALIADWVAIYEGNYGKEPTGATIAAYRIGLLDLKPDLLHKAFSICLKDHAFWPNVAEVRKAYSSAADDLIPFAALPEHDDSMTPEESKKVFADIEKRFRQTKAWQPEVPKPIVRGPVLVVTITDAMRERAKKQVEELKKKYPNDFKAQK